MIELKSIIIFGRQCFFFPLTYILLCLFLTTFTFVVLCRDTGDTCSSLDDRADSNSGLDMSCQTNIKSVDIPVCFTSGNISFQDQSHPGYMQPAFVSGWMYVNENGQMCGPYIQEQLYEGLTTGFLPAELPVYPVINGALMNPVPLNYFKQFPDHVATGFVYLSMSSSVITMPTGCSTSSGKDMTSYRQGSFEHAPPTAVNLDSETVFQSHVNCTSKEFLTSNSKVPNCIMSCLRVVQNLLSVKLSGVIMVVILPYLFAYLIVVRFTFYSSYMKNAVGFMRMKKE